MSDMNKVILIGRLTRDAELKYTAQGKPLSKFTLAVNEQRKYGEGYTDEASYFDVNFWGKPAENLNQYLVKGKQIALEGKLRQERWQQDSQNRSRVVVEAASIQLLGDGRKPEQSAPSEMRAPMPRPETKPDADSEPAPGGNGISDIPF